MYCFYLKRVNKRYELVLSRKNEASEDDILVSSKEFGSIKYAIEALEDLSEANMFSHLDKRLFEFFDDLIKDFLNSELVKYHRCLDIIFDKLED
jgi:hypothetical protein